MLVGAKSKPHDIVIYTDSSVTRDRSGWGLTVKQGGRTVHEDGRINGNERADRLTSTADITSGLQLGRAQVLRGLANFLNVDRPQYHSIDRLKERGVEKGSCRHSTLQGRERSVFNQTNIGTVWETAERRGGARMGLSERHDATLS